MKELGQKIREARLLKKLTHEELFEKTRIIADTIRAIEEGETSFLPKPHYRAFVKTLANEVGLEPEALLREFDSRQRRLNEEKSAMQSPEETQVRLKRFWDERSKQVVLFGFVFIVLVLAVLYMKYGKDLFYDPDPGKLVMTTIDSSLSTGFMLELEGLHGVWVDVRVDSGAKEVIFLEENQKHVYYGKEIIYLGIGDAKGVRLLHNGTQLLLKIQEGKKALDVWINESGIAEMKGRPSAVKYPKVIIKTEKPKRNLQGVVAIEELLDHYPEYAHQRDQYHPDVQIIKQIEDLQADIHLVCFFGVWDTLSSEIIPRLLCIHQLVDSHRYSLQLVAVNRELQDPSEFIKRYRIQGVPAIVFLSQDIELGRIVGRPNQNLEKLFLQNVQKSKYLIKSNEEAKPDTVFEDVGNR